MFDIGDKVYRVYPGAMMNTRDIGPKPDLHADKNEYEVIVAPDWIWWESEEIVWVKPTFGWYGTPIPIFREFLFPTYEEALACAKKVEKANASR